MRQRRAEGPSVAEIRAASDILARASIATRAGITFAGKRDLYEALGYRKTLLPEDYRSRYERGDIAARIVEALPKATWRGGAELIEDEDPNVVTDFEEAWAELSRRLRIWPTLSRADVLAGLGRYSVILIGAPGLFSEELPHFTDQSQVAYLQPFSEADAEIDQWVTQTDDPRFGLPLRYRLSRVDPSAIGGRGAKGQRQYVHWTRIIHVADGVLDENAYGQPRLQRIWNRLDDLDKVIGGGAEAFWHRAHQGMQLDLDPEITLTPGSAEEKALKDEVDEYEHGLRRTLRTQGVKLKMLGSDVANFSGPADAIVAIISAATGIPQRILMGSERGQLASTQDDSNWDERVTDRRNEWAGPHVVCQLADRLIEYGALPQPVEYEVRWPQVQNLDEQGKAKLADTYAGINQKQGETVITTDEIRDRALGLPPLAEIDGNEDDEEREETEEELRQRARAEDERGQGGEDDDDDAGGAA
jgi:hypothetical protein